MHHENYIIIMGIAILNKAKRSAVKPFMSHDTDQQRNHSNGNNETNTSSKGFVVVSPEEVQRLRVNVYPYIL